MAKSTAEKLLAILRNLESSTPHIEATAVVGADGLVMASRLSAEMEEERVGAMSAAMLALGERSSMELNRGDIEQVLVKGERGYIVLRSAGPEALIVTLTTENVKLGLLFLELRRTAEALREAL
jgi:predicted regulator of Ras-like GTPase activity (Roadblock/LC7/MglB family)